MKLELCKCDTFELYFVYEGGLEFSQTSVITIPSDTETIDLPKATQLRFLERKI